MAVHEPSELIYPPRSSWLPAILAAGLGGLITGLFTWWPFALIGGAVALLALRAWIRDAGREHTRLPRRQRASTAPLPLRPPPRG